MSLIYMSADKTVIYCLTVERPDSRDGSSVVTLEKITEHPREETAVTLEELRRQAARAKSDRECLDREVQDATDEALRAQMAGDAALERNWQERAAQLQAAAD